MSFSVLQSSCVTCKGKWCTLVILVLKSDMLSNVLTFKFWWFNQIKIFDVDGGGIRTLMTDNN